MKPAALILILALFCTACKTMATTPDAAQDQQAVGTENYQQIVQQLGKPISFDNAYHQVSSIERFKGEFETYR